MTTYFFGDNYEPTVWDSIVGNQPTWEYPLTTAYMTDGEEDKDQIDAIRYALYSDADTFLLWSTWAFENKLTDNTNDEDFAGDYVLAITATYPVIKSDDDNDEDTMCIADATNAHGAICIQTVKADVATKTILYTEAAWSTAWSDFITPLSPGPATSVLAISGTGITDVDPTTDATAFTGF